MSPVRPRSIEVSAKTVEEAVAKALRELGCARAEVDVEVLHPGTPGRLLGFGAELARVRVTRVLQAPADPVAPETEANPVAPETEADASLSLFTAPAGDVSNGYTTAPAAPAASAAPAADSAAEDADALEADDEGEAPAPPAGDPADEAELARLMLAELLNHMGMRGLQVEVMSVQPITLNIRGGDVADLIGRRGEHLRALQFVLVLMLNKQLRRHTRVTVDADGYRARREVLLQGMAEHLAHRVRATRQPMQLEAMPPNERRIVHLALADDPDVTTESVGEGETRRVVLKPRH